MDRELIQQSIYQNIKEVIELARTKTARAINFAMVEAYWNIGKLIVEEEQGGKARAIYGDQLLIRLSKQLTLEFGKGFNARNLRNMRSFYTIYKKWNAVRTELSWTHYRILLRVEKENTRTFYMSETIDNQWSTRELERQVNSFYYERLLASQNKAPLIKKAEDNTQFLQPTDFIKDPYVLEFLDFKSNTSYHEKILESAILNKLQEFLLELGKGFSFVARQKRVSTETSKHFYIDLVFYNFILKCFVIIDLKVGALTHQDIGQLDMYVRLYEEKWRGVDDNPTIGVILCSEKDHTIVKYSVLKESQQLFASKYKLHLPSEEELAAELNREIQEIKMLRRLEEE
ncbi:MAG: PDDEXK nuclease domain-containing protein [Bacteroidota bacterium]